jgi:dihydrofolate reductase
MSDRKVILKMVISLDGFATSPDGTHEWMFEWFGDDSSERSLRALEEAGVHAMGRRSYETMGPHWAASEGPIATAMNEKRRLSSPTPWRRRNGGRPRSSAGT